MRYGGSSHACRTSTQWCNLWTSARLSGANGKAKGQPGKLDPLRELLPDAVRSRPGDALADVVSDIAAYAPRERRGRSVIGGRRVPATASG